MFSREILEELPDRLLADRAKNLLADICERPDAYDLGEIGGLYQQAQGSLARFACLLSEWDYTRRDNAMPWEVPADRFSVATLWQQWHRTDWTVVARAIAPTIPQFCQVLASRRVA